MNCKANIFVLWCWLISKKFATNKNKVIGFSYLEIIKYFIKDNKRVARLIFKASPNNSLDIKQGIFTPSLSLKPNNHWNFYKFRKENKQLVFKTDRKTKIRTNTINTVLYCCGCIDLQNEEKKSESTGKNSCWFDWFINIFRI